MSGCGFCSFLGYIKIPLKYYIRSDGLAKTNFAYKICPVCRWSSNVIYTNNDFLGESICKFCKGNKAIILIDNTLQISSICLVCRGSGLNIFSYPMSLKADYWLEDYYGKTIVKK